MTTAEILAAFPQLRALVVGDVCLDRWCSYDPNLAEPSRETGIPRIGVVSTEVTPGAAGTVANNLVALKTGKVAVLGLAGNDGNGYELRSALQARGIASLLVEAPQIPTFTYTKLINRRTGAEDIPRVDFIYTEALPETLDRALVSALEQAAPGFDVILVSDQAETSAGGVVTAAMREALTRIPNVLVWVDSRLRAEHFRNVLVKPNRQEAEAASMRALGRVDYAELRRRMHAPALVITHGAEGALVVTEAGSTLVPTRGVGHPVDICGAGDSFSAGAALTLKVTGDAVEAARFGNLIASITIMKKGTGTASPEEVIRAQARWEAYPG
jgi:rfaE bifunctional protein kinase chain/domain